MRAMNPAPTTAPDRAAGASAQAAARRVAFVRRMALACALLVLAITCLSAYIRLAKAGLSCADWPACYGQSLRELQAGAPPLSGEGAATAAARLAHRIVASTALLLVLAMLAACLSARPVPWREAGGAAALVVLALLLALLGRWSSDARVPAVAIGNLVGGFAMLALSVQLALRPAAGLPPRWRRAAWLATGLVFVQVALGALASASFSATSCPAGLGQCVAAARELPWSALSPWREPQLAAVAPINAAGALALAIHWLLGMALALALVPLALAALRAGRRAAGALLLAALGLAVALGWTMASQGATLALALAHNVAAAAALVAVFVLAAKGRAR